MVPGAGLDRLRDQPGCADHVPSASRYWGVYLPARRNQNREHLVRAHRARTPLRPIRFRYPHGPGDGRVDHSLASGPAGLARYLSADWFRGAIVGDPLALGYKREARPSIPAGAVHPQPETGTALVTDQPKPDWYLSRFLLLRLLLVSVCHLAPGLSGDRPPLHHPARRLFLLAALLCIWSQRTFGRLDR